MFAQLFRVPDPTQDLRLIHRQFDRLFSDWARPPQRRVAGPAFDVFDDGPSYRLVADVPGLRAEELEVEVTEEGLAVRGTRKLDVPEGFSATRRERRSLELSRSFTFPTKLDAENVTATLAHGVLTITLGKRADTKPRTIAVQAA